MLTYPWWLSSKCGRVNTIRVPVFNGISHPLQLFGPIKNPTFLNWSICWICQLGYHQSELRTQHQHMQPNACLKSKTIKCVWFVPHLCTSVNQQVRFLSLAAVWNEKHSNSALGMGRFNRRDSCLHARKADKFSQDAISTIHKVICLNAGRMQKACGFVGNMEL